jgi:hypothetical protein
MVMPTKAPGEGMSAVSCSVGPEVSMPRPPRLTSRSRSWSLIAACFCSVGSVELSIDLPFLETSGAGMFGATPTTTCDTNASHIRGRTLVACCN